MIPTEKTEAFYSFLDEYTGFLGEMEQFEQQKLSTMLSGRLAEIEHAIAVAQANAKQLQNLEEKRMRLQQDAGLGAMSMGELVAAESGERSRQLERQLHQLSQSLGNIRFYNSKAMAVAEDRLRRSAGAKTADGGEPRAMLEVNA